LFDAFKEGVDQTPIHRLRHTQAWKAGLAFLQDGYFWEAHEVLEAVWMACPQNSAERLMVQAIIQRANAGLKGKMGKEKAMARLSDLSANLYREAVDRAGGAVLGLA
jgi:predicted metal-dependent hydrolase